MTLDEITRFSVPGLNITFIGNLTNLPLLVLSVVLFLFLLMSIALFYHWFSYGRGSLSPVLTSIVYLIGASVFISSAYLSALQL